MSIESFLAHVYSPRGKSCGLPSPEKLALQHGLDLSLVDAFINKCLETFLIGSDPTKTVKQDHWYVQTELDHDHELPQNAGQFRKFINVKTSP